MMTGTALSHIPAIALLYTYYSNYGKILEFLFSGFFPDCSQDVRSDRSYFSGHRQSRRRPERKSTMSRKITANIMAAGATALILLAGAGSAQAETVEVRYYASELSTQAGVERVSQRINRKVRRACRTASIVSSPRSRRECRDDLTAQVVGKIDHPVLTAMYSDSRSGLLASNTAGGPQ
ncbi:MAG: UrcA family protein [Pseudomonadota bacterium]